MNITKQDINFLYFLYKMRCFSLQEISNFFYTNKNFYKENLIPLLKNKLIIMQKNKNQYVFMITQNGIDLLQNKLNIPSEVFNIDKGKVEKTILKQKDVAIKPEYISHQVALNDFVLNFRRKYGKIEYFDERFLSGMINIRPDGMIRLPHIDLFLEQDMGSETSKQLSDKWNRYRRYLNNEYTGDKKIIVLFIIDCIDGEKRDLLVRRSIMQNFDQNLSDKFDIYVGDKNTILEACFNRIIPGDKNRTADFNVLMKRHGFKIADGSKIKAKLNGTVYRYYFSKLKDGKIIYYNPNKTRRGRFAEFFADNYDYCPMTILSKIQYHDKNSHNFDLAYSPRANMRLIGYIVLTNDLHRLYRHLATCELLNVENVYYTTPERLMRMPLPRALVRFNNNGEIISCNDYYFDPVVKEGKISEHDKKGLRKII